MLPFPPTWALGSALFLLPIFATAQTSFNRWEAQPPAPVSPPSKATKAIPATQKKAAIVEVIANPASPDSGKTKYVYVEVMPEFPGGYPNYQNYVRKNLKRPKGSKEAGKVWVTFMVLPSGAVTNVHVPPGKGINATYDAAAVELLNKAPLFTPGKREGKPAAIEVKLPVEFR